MPASIICTAAHEDRAFRVVAGAANLPTPCVEVSVGIAAMGEQQWTRVTEASDQQLLWCAVQALLAAVMAQSKK